MEAPFIYHGQDDSWVQHHNKQLTLTLVTSESHSFLTVYVRSEPDNEELLTKMEPIHTQGRLQFWQATIPINTDKDITNYTFKLCQNKRQWWLHGAGKSNRIPPIELHFKYNAVNLPPEWVSQQVFYQIFPDRFCNGNPEISVKSNQYNLRGDHSPTVAKAWGDPVGEHAGTGASEFYGGDLAGIHSKLDYLQELGVTTLYLNPIFSAPSNHKYDTTDYLNIDQHLGTNQEFIALTQELHQRGMKVVLDAVFNHTSVDHPWFDKYQRSSEQKGAFGNPSSPYRDYYFFEGDTNHYIGWKGIDHLPVLNFSNQAVRDYIYQAEDAVIKHWLKPPYSIDGWRFDVIHMLGEGEGAKNNAHYVKEFRKASKEVNSDAYMLGEHFFEASQWLQGDQEDGSMNYYGFSHPLRAYLINLDISFESIAISDIEFSVWLNEARAKIPWKNQLAQLNQLDSHDTARFISLLNNDVKLFKLAVQFLFCYPGVPCLYYGTEIGLEGMHDPDNRRCFPWERVNNCELFPYFKKLIQLRTSLPSLQTGNYQQLLAESGLFVFARTNSHEVTISLINTHRHAQNVSLPVWQTGIEEATFTNMMDGSQYQASNGLLHLPLEEKEGMVLHHQYL